MFRSSSLCPLTFVAFSFAVLFQSQLITRSLNPCLEVTPGTTYKCMELNLSGIPPDIPTSTQSLDLSFNPLEILTSNYFSSVSALKFLDLTRCHIQKIEDNAFVGLWKLSVLILTANPLHFLGPRAFHDLVSLQRLIAVETKLSSLNKLPIGHLTSLQDLNLSNNYIDSLKLPKYFSHLIFLRFLSLQANKISSISVGDLDALSSYNLTLLLSKNDIKYIEVNAFLGLHIQEISLRGCFESSTVMQASLQNLTGLHVKSLVLGEYRNMKKLKTFSKSILDALCHMYLQEITLISIGDVIFNTGDLFPCLNNISSVRLVDTYTEDVSNFPENSSIRYLEFKNCKFKEVPSVRLSSLKELRSLRITRTKRLVEFEADFQGLQKLETLDLSENRLTADLCWICLRNGVPNLKYMNLSFNYRISLVTECHALPKLEKLDLQHTTLSGTGEYPVFLCLVNLIYLDISYTGTNIKSECSFCGLNSLLVLKMAGNTFENNKLVNILKNLTNLQILDISNCRLQSLSLDSLGSLRELRELNISHNKLLGLHSEAYAQLQALTILDFHSNQLAIFTEKDLENFPRSLKSLYLSRNPFDCSCENLNFLQWAKQKRNPLQHPESMFCHSPMHLRDVRLMDFDLSSCHVSTTTVATSVSISMVLVLSLILVYKYYFHLYYMAVLLSGRRRSTENDNVYDAFVIYSSKDQEWVKRELEETLEAGVPRFRLCFFYRDFIPGVPIITNIVQEGFQSSRKVIAVVSSHFLDSRWCNFELEVAQSWQLLDSNASMILIVLEGVDKAVVQRKLGVFRYLRRNTYLVWKDLELNRHMFLRHLRSALLDGKTWTEEELRLMLTG
ncbi:toll-like receptor 4 [Rhineura floridana]|uniref:toll-like receptor 4 n=1 Tax=Rhineura floridana TaxID=261503 RepID=UPI002AC840F5|nr:toll-like receptor 4 [Rhineura floridana]